LINEEKSPIAIKHTLDPGSRVRRKCGAKLMLLIRKKSRHPQSMRGEYFRQEWNLWWELRQDLLVEPCQLAYLVRYGPQEDLADPCCLELEQFFGALGRCSNGQSLAQQLDGATQGRTHHLNEEFFCQASVLRQIVEQRAQRVWEALWLPADLMQRVVQSRQGVCKRRWGDVIGGSKPTISQASDPAQSRL
jgi:hypothetical protein